MTKLFNIMCAGMLSVAVSGCGLSPKHVVAHGNELSSVQVVGAPKGAIVRIDGVATTIDKKEGIITIVVSDGWHAVEVELNSVAIHSEKIFVQDGSTRIVNLKI